MTCKKSHWQFPKILFGENHGRHSLMWSNNLLKIGRINRNWK